MTNLDCNTRRADYFESQYTPHLELFETVEGDFDLSRDEISDRLHSRQFLARGIRLSARFALRPGRQQCPVGEDKGHVVWPVVSEDERLVKHDAVQAKQGQLCRHWSLSELQPSSSSAAVACAVNVAGVLRTPSTLFISHTNEPP